MVAATQTTRFLPFLDPAEEGALLAAAPIKSFDRGQLVLDQNAQLKAIFLIEDGAVRIERRDGDLVVPLALLEPGEFFGEMSFVDGAPTSAQVVANVRTTLRAIDMGTLDNLSDVDPTFGARLFRSIAAIVVERLRVTSADLLLQKPWV